MGSLGSMIRGHLPVSARDDLARIIIKWTLAANDAVQAQWAAPTFFQLPAGTSATPMALPPAAPGNPWIQVPMAANPPATPGPAQGLAPAYPVLPTAPQLPHGGKGYNWTPGTMVLATRQPLEAEEEWHDAEDGG